MMVMILETAKKVFGPDEQPRSAMATLSGNVVQHKSSTACSSRVMDLDSNAVYTYTKSNTLFNNYMTKPVNLEFLVFFITLCIWVSSCVPDLTNLMGVIKLKTN